MTERTNNETQDDENVQIRSKKASGVVTPAVTGKTDCKKFDRGQRRPIHQSDATPTRYGEGQKQSINQSDKIAKDVKEWCMQQEEYVY